ncbi:non-canonical purine NTP pyrophosphatase [Candidatus Woesearchaeota archaeon]|nr:non-canonical purine NTP pyrophosphatase [Candidatus Woesearchaeota archaeon]
MKPVFVTSNRNKAAEFKAILGSLVDVALIEYPELKADNPCEISKTASKALSERLKRAVVVEDSGLFIAALKGFPGTSSKYITGMIGNRGILKLMAGIKNRKCLYKSAIGYCAPGKAPVCFLGVEDGKVALKEKGKNGWGNDFIFIPKGKSRTYAELKKPGESGKFRIIAIEKLKGFLSSGND